MATIVPHERYMHTEGDLISATAVVWQDFINPLWCLPQKLTPNVARRALNTLTEAATTIQHAALSSFVAELVLVDYETFLTAPAAISHHHAFPGGLLVHYAGMWDRLVPWLASEETEDTDLAIAAILAHDIGKLRKTGSAAYNPVNRYQTHELLGIEIINGPLRHLGDEWPEGAARLNRALYWMLGRSPHRPFTSKLGEAISKVDQEDAAAAPGGLPALASSA